MRRSLVVLALAIGAPWSANAIPVVPESVYQSVSVSVNLAYEGGATLGDSDGDSARGEVGWFSQVDAVRSVPGASGGVDEVAARSRQSSTIEFSRDVPGLTAFGTAESFGWGSMMDPGFESYVLALTTSRFRIDMLVKEPLRVALTYWILADYAAGSEPFLTENLYESKISICDQSAPRCIFSDVVVDRDAGGPAEESSNSAEIVVNPGVYTFEIRGDINGYAVQPNELVSRVAWSFDLVAEPMPEPAAPLLGAASLLVVASLRRRAHAAAPVDSDIDQQQPGGEDAVVESHAALRYEGELAAAAAGRGTCAQRS